MAVAPAGEEFFERRRCEFIEGESAGSQLLQPGERLRVRDVGGA
jgi:hypothetical protein